MKVIMINTCMKCVNYNIL